MRATSSGLEVMVSPWRANRTATVNNRPIIAAGATRGMNTLSYHSRLRARSPISLVSHPATSGTPKKMRTIRAISHSETWKAEVSKPSQSGRTCR